MSEGYVTRVSPPEAIDQAKLVASVTPVPLGLLSVSAPDGGPTVSNWASSTTTSPLTVTPAGTATVTVMTLVKGSGATGIGSVVA